MSVQRCVTAYAAVMVVEQLCASSIVLISLCERAINILVLVGIGGSLFEPTADPNPCTTNPLLPKT